MCMAWYRWYTYISIFKPKLDFIEDYYFHTIKEYLIVIQVVNIREKFMDIYVGLTRSVNDPRILEKLSLYKQA